MKRGSPSLHSFEEEYTDDGTDAGYRYYYHRKCASHPDTGLPGLAVFLPFPALTPVFYACVDVGVLVTIETDFFHRETGSWNRTRWQEAICLYVSTVVLALETLVPSGVEIALGEGTFHGMTITLVMLFLVVGARTADKTLRSSISPLALYFVPLSRGKETHSQNTFRTISDLDRNSTIFNN